MRAKKRGRGTMEEQMVVFCTVQYSTALSWSVQGTEMFQDCDVIDD